MPPRETPAPGSSSHEGQREQPAAVVRSREQLRHHGGERVAAVAGR